MSQQEIAPAVSAAGLSQGKLTLPSNCEGGVAQYEGQMSGGKANGRGIATFEHPDGSAYVGERYEGEWLENKKHGYGEVTYADGDHYEGYWAHDQKHGQGKCTWGEDGSVREGEWSANEFVGAQPAAALATARQCHSFGDDAVASTGTHALRTTTRHPELLGDKASIRKTLARHIVATIMSDHPGRSFKDLRILELGSGAGFFAQAYREVYADLLETLVQTDAEPQHAEVTTLDVSGLASYGHQFDVVLSIDVLSCLSFGAGLDPEDDEDIDALAALNDGLRCALAAGSAYYDFMVCAPNSQFVLRFVPEYCSSCPGRFICVLDPDGDVTGGASKGEEDEPLLFVTFDASLLRHVNSDVGPLLHVTGHESPFTYASLCERLRPATCDDQESQAFALKVLELLFRNINVGGCPGNWELLSYVSVDPAHFSEVFEGDSERLAPVFLETFRRAVLFLRESFKGKGVSYDEFRVVDAFRSTVATHLTHYTVESTEEDVVGSDGGCYTQCYHTAQVHDGDPDGHGSFRCLVTKCELPISGD